MIMNVKNTGAPNVLMVDVGETISLMAMPNGSSSSSIHKVRQKQKAAQNSQEQPENTAATKNQGSANQGKWTLGSMHHGLANVSLPSLSALFCCTYVMFIDSGDDDSV